MSPAHVPKTGNGGDAGLRRAAIAVEEPGRLEQHRQRRGLASRDDEPVQAVEIGRALDPAPLAPDVVEGDEVLTDVTLEVEHADHGTGRVDLGPRYHPRSARCSPYCDSSSPRIASPRPRDTFATWSGSS